MIVPENVIQAIKDEILADAREGWCDDCVATGMPEAYIEGVTDVINYLNEINFNAIVGHLAEGEAAA